MSTGVATDLKAKQKSPISLVAIMQIIMTLCLFVAVRTKLQRMFF